MADQPDRIEPTLEALEPRRNAPVPSQIRQEGLDFSLSHLRGLSFLVIENKASDPMRIGLIGPVTVMAQSNRLAQSVQKFSSHRFIRRLWIRPKPGFDGENRAMANWLGKQ